MFSSDVIDKIYFVCRQYFGDNERAEDIAHDTFVGILRWPPKENLDEVDMSFLKKLVFRYAGQQDGRNTLHLNRSKNEINDPEGNFDVVSTNTPEVMLYLKQLHHFLYAAMKALPPKMHEGLLNLYWKEVKLNRSQQVMVWDARNKIAESFRKKRLDLYEICDTFTIRHLEEA